MIWGHRYIQKHPNYGHGHVFGAESLDITRILAARSPSAPNVTRTTSINVPNITYDLGHPKLGKNKKLAMPEKICCQILSEHCVPRDLLVIICYNHHFHSCSLSKLPYLVGLLLSQTGPVGDRESPWIMTCLTYHDLPQWNPNLFICYPIMVCKLSIEWWYVNYLVPICFSQELQELSEWIRLFPQVLSEIVPDWE